MARAKIILEDGATVAEWMAIMYIVKEAWQVGKAANLFWTGYLGKSQAENIYFICQIEIAF